MKNRTPLLARRMQSRQTRLAMRFPSRTKADPGYPSGQRALLPLLDLDLVCIQSKHAKHTQGKCTISKQHTTNSKRLTAIERHDREAFTTRSRYTSASTLDTTTKVQSQPQFFCCSYASRIDPPLTIYTSEAMTRNQHWHTSPSARNTFCPWLPP